MQEVGGKLRRGQAEDEAGRRVGIHTRAHTHTCARAHTHTYTHTHTQMQVQNAANAAACLSNDGRHMRCNIRLRSQHDDVAASKARTPEAQPVGVHCTAQAVACAHVLECSAPVRHVAPCRQPVAWGSGRPSPTPVVKNEGCDSSARKR
jgi:hypothetical protein